MTDTLKQLLHEKASASHFDPVDVDALVADGDRLVRRRRWGAVGATAAAAVAVVAVAPALVGGSSNATDPAGNRGIEHPTVTGDLPRDMFAQGRVIWAVDSVIHYGDVTVEVHRPVDAFVRTEIGFVFASDGEVWQVDGDAQRRIGTVDAENPHLVSDEETPEAGWVDPTGDRPAFVVYDHGTGATQRFDEFTTPGMGSQADEEDPANFYAVDDGTAYWRDSRGAVATDLSTGEARVVDAGARNGFGIRDVEDDLVAFSAEQGTLLGQTRQDPVTVLDGAYGDLGDFSPDARWFISDADEPHVYDTRTGELVSFDLPGYGFATGVGWIDEETLVMLAARSDSGPVELLSCEVTTGACTSYVDLGTFDEITQHVQLPVGEDIGGD